MEEIEMHYGKCDKIGLRWQQELDTLEIEEQLTLTFSLYVLTALKSGIPYETLVLIFKKSYEEGKKYIESEND